MTQPDTSPPDTPTHQQIPPLKQQPRTPHNAWSVPQLPCNLSPFISATARVYWSFTLVHCCCLDCCTLLLPTAPTPTTLINTTLSIHTPIMVDPPHPQRFPQPAQQPPSPQCSNMTWWLIPPKTLNDPCRDTGPPEPMARKASKQHPRTSPNPPLVSLLLLCQHLLLLLHNLAPDCCARCAALSHYQPPVAPPHCCEGLV